MSSRKASLATAIFFLLSATGIQAEMDLFPIENKHLIVQNRVLVKVGASTISVLDVVKKMEVFLNKHYPQYADSLPAKHQYFSSQWRDVLSQMIDHELILMDAEKMELKISDAEVRETLADRFGPNVMTTLDKIGLSYEEARAMVHSELTVQKMTWFKVHAKALASVNVQDIKYAYQEYCIKNPPKEEWEYQTVSVRAPNEEVAATIAQKAFELCQHSPSIINEIIETLKTPATSSPTEEQPSFQISLSDTIKTETKNLSENYKTVLSSLAEQAISQPIKQPSKSTKESVYRLFYLKSHKKTSVPTLRALHEKIQNQLVQEISEQEFRSYITKLRDRYGFDTKLEESIPSDFQPFSLQ